MILLRLRLLVKTRPYNRVNNTVRVYDGNLIRSINIPEMRKLQSKALFGKWCFIPVKKNKNTGKYETLEKAYKRIHEERNVLLEESKKIGLTIDLFMCHVRLLGET